MLVDFVSVGLFVAVVDIGSVDEKVNLKINQHVANLLIDFIQRYRQCHVQQEINHRNYSFTFFVLAVTLNNKKTIKS